MTWNPEQERRRAAERWPCPHPYANVPPRFPTDLDPTDGDLPPGRLRRLANRLRAWVADRRQRREDLAAAYAVLDARWAWQQERKVRAAELVRRLLSG